MSDPYADGKPKLRKVTAEDEDKLKQFVGEPREDIYTPPISRKTVDQLNQMAAAMERMDKESQPDEPEESTEVEDEDDDRLDVGAVPRDYQTVYYQNTPWDNPDIRKRIEARCSPMKFTDLIMTGRVKQEIPILPGKLEIVFESLTGKDNLWIATEASRRYSSTFDAQVWIGYAKLTMSLIQMNDKRYPDYRKKGEIDPDLFEDKYDMVTTQGDKTLSVLLANLRWFEDRQDNMFDDDFDQLKNG